MKKLLLLCLTTLFCATTWAYDFEVDGIYYNIDPDEELTVKVTWGSDSYTTGTESYVGTIVVPETVYYDGYDYTVTAIGEYAFYKCSELTELILPSGITAIEPYAFYRNAFTELEIPSDVTTIGNHAFYRCTELTSIVVPEQVDTLEASTFAECSALETIQLPEGLVYIGSSAFNGCSSLSAINVPESVTTIEDRVFYMCTSLTELTIPKNITKLNTYTVYRCESLSNVFLPEGLISIESNALSKCYVLDEITIPSTVSTIGSSAFRYCYALDKITSLNPEPPTCSTSYVFDEINDECVLYVPVGSKDAYTSANIWKSFYSIIEMVEPIIETLEATNVTDTSATLNGNVVKGYQEIVEKGFEYWAEGGEVQSIIVDSDDDGEISFTLSELHYDTTYTYRTYATIETGITAYGEEMTFTTGVPEGISSIFIDSSEVEDIYSTIGQRLNNTQKGLNIVRMTDGTTKKVLMK